MPNWFELDDKILNSHELAVPLIELALGRGIDADRLLSGSGLFLQDLRRQSVSISPKQLFALIGNIDKYSRSQDIGFLMGRRLLRQQSHQATQLLDNARNPLQMLRIANCHHSALFPFIHLHTRRYQDKYYLLFPPGVCHSDHYQFLLEMMLTSMVSQLKEAMGFQVPVEFSFNFPRPRNIYQYEENLGNKLKFDQHLMMLSIESKWMHQDFGQDNPMMRQHYLSALSGTQRAPQGFLQRMAQFIQHRSNPTLEKLSQETGLSPATLKRKFKLHGCSFQQLSDDIRKQQAIFELQVHNAPNEYVARGLNFSDLTNFRRSFKRWTGLTPSEVKCQS